VGDRTVSDIVRDFFKNAHSILWLADELYEHGHGSLLHESQQKTAKLSRLRAKRADIDAEIALLERG
jgi:hypothetical protein